jgi:hypothetical protein
MPSSLLIPIILVTATAALLWLGARPLRDWLRRREVEQARESFRLQREVLEAKFFELASTSGKPRDVRWHCEWLDQVTFARNRKTGLLAAFASVNIRFEAIEGGDMEDVAAVGEFRDAVAVFHYESGHWGTGGKALFSMNPADALVHLKSQFEPV